MRNGTFKRLKHFVKNSNLVLYFSEYLKICKKTSHYRVGLQLNIQHVTGPLGVMQSEASND